MTTGLIEKHSTDFAAGHTATPVGLGWASQGREELLVQFERIAALEPNWDSYEAKEIDSAALRAAQAFAEQALTLPLTMPAVVPVPDGGVQLEWSAGSVDLELEFEPGGNLAVFVCDDHQAGQQIDGEWPQDAGLFRIALRRLAAHT